MKVSQAKLDFARTVLQSTPRTRVSLRRTLRAFRMARNDARHWADKNRFNAAIAAQCVTESLAAQALILIESGARFAR
jgi:hypothetical protein